MDSISRDLHAYKMLRRPLQLLHCQAPSDLLQEPQALGLMVLSDSESLLVLDDLWTGADND